MSEKGENVSHSVTQLSERGTQAMCMKYTERKFLPAVFLWGQLTYVLNCADKIKILVFILFPHESTLQCDHNCFILSS